MCELLCTVIITVKKGNIVYIKHDVSHEILILDTIYSTAQRHCPLTRRPEPARALIVNI